MQKLRNRHFLSIAVLVFVCVLLFANTFKSPFIWDDLDIIVDNQYIRNLGNVFEFFKAGYWEDYMSQQGTRYLPLRTLSFAVDYSIWKLNVFGYHLTNLLLHIANVLLVYWLAFLIFKSAKFDVPAQQKGALAAGLLFAAFPMHVESITWIKNRTDLITLVFYLFSLIFFIVSSREKGRNYVLYCLAVLSFVLTLLSKEMGITLPAILVIYILSFRERSSWKKHILATIPFWFVSGLYMVFKVFVIKAGTLKDYMLTPITLWENIVIVFGTIAYYFKLLLFPFSFSAERLLFPPAGIWDLYVLLSIAVVAVLILGLWVLWKRSKLLFFALSWILIALAPVSNVFYIAGRPIAEQRLYIPSVGFCLFLGFTYVFSQNQGLALRQTGTVALCILLLLYSIFVIKRNKDWQSEVGLWLKTVQVSPLGPRAHNNLGRAYMGLNKFDEAIEEFKLALKANSTFFLANINLGIVYTRRGWINDAIGEFKKALLVDPDFVETRNNLGVVYTLKKMHKEAIIEYQAAIKLNPNKADPHYNIAMSYMDIGQYDLARAEFTRSLELDPARTAVYRFLALIDQKQNNFDSSINGYRKAIKLMPERLDLHLELGALLEQNGRYNEAIEEYKNALKKDAYFVDAFIGLGDVYITTGETTAAKNMYARALELAPGNTEIKQKYKKLLNGK